MSGSKLKMSGTNSLLPDILSVTLAKVILRLALVQILSHGGARGVCYILPTVKKMPDDVIEKSANHTAEFTVGVCWYW
jgi:hypothetical protein